MKYTFKDKKLGQAVARYKASRKRTAPHARSSSAPRQLMRPPATGRAPDFEHIAAVVRRVVAGLGLRPGTVGGPRASLRPSRRPTKRSSKPPTFHAPALKRARKPKRRRALKKAVVHSGAHSFEVSSSPHIGKKRVKRVSKKRIAKRPKIRKGPGNVALRKKISKKLTHKLGKKSGKRRTAKKRSR